MVVVEVVSVVGEEVDSEEVVVEEEVDVVEDLEEEEVVAEVGDVEVWPLPLLDCL